ncbi:hypothetical protein LSAT2_012396 [Lamellibrachia satsuma]|nr:hypothetical protein LSAT2_012396 [Lamellibrachia satsuma]
MGRPVYQDNWQAEEELVIPEFLMKAANGSRNIDLRKSKRIVQDEYQPANHLFELLPSAFSDTVCWNIT